MVFHFEPFFVYQPSITDKPIDIGLDSNRSPVPFSITQAIHWTSSISTGVFTSRRLDFPWPSFCHSKPTCSTTRLPSGFISNRSGEKRPQLLIWAMIQGDDHE